MGVFKRKNKISAERRRPVAENKNAVFSYHTVRQQNDSNSNSNNTNEVTARKTKRPHSPSDTGKVKNIPAVVTLITIGVVLILGLSLSNKPKVAMSQQNKALQLRSQQEYQDQITSIFKASPLSLTKLSINTNELTAKIKEKFPEIKSAIITVPLFGHTAVVHLEVTEPTFIVEGSGGSYVMDSRGVLVAPVKTVGGLSSGIIKISDQSGLTLREGEKAMTQQDVAFITTFLNQLRIQQFEAKSIILPASANQVNIYLKDKPYYIKANLSGDPRVQAGAFLAASDKLNNDHKTPGEYYDVRVDEKVYYK